MKEIGIIGGIGPAATICFEQLIVKRTVADRDQDYIPMATLNDTRIPDRTEAILHGGADPRPEMKKSAKLLEDAGADFLIMACNTAHYFYDSVCEEISIPVLHMPRETAKCLLEKGVKKAGILATDGTCLSGVYGDALAEAGIEALYPSEEKQKVIMSLIYDYIKAGRVDFPDHYITEVISEMQEKGAEVLILGCTELPIVFDKMTGLPIPAIDHTDVLAKAAVRFAGAPLKELPPETE